jgi:hypothetical protein
MKQHFIALALIIHASVSWSQITIDGNTKDWSDNEQLKYYDKVAHIEYDVKHNDSNLFVCVKISDPKFQLKSTLAGMTLYLDTTGKKKQQMGIQFPLKSGNGSPMEMGAMGAPDSLAMRKKINTALEKASKKGFLEGNGSFTVAELPGAEIVGKMDQAQQLVIEYRIPFQSIYGYTDLTRVKKDLSIVFFIDKLEMPSFGDGGPGDGPMSGPPPSFPGGGGPDGEMPDFAEIEQFLQSSTTVLKYSLLK